MMGGKKIIENVSRNDSFEEKKWGGRLKVLYKVAKIVLMKARYKRGNLMRMLSQQLASQV